MISNFKKLFHYRELLFSLTKKELKVKYRGSVLGFFWSLLNPVLMMLVYSFVFSIIMRQGVKDYAIFLVSALLPFNFLSNSINYGAGSIINNSNLVKKIYFPKEIIPLSIVFSNLINFLLELVVLFIILIIFRYPFYRFIYFLPLIIFIQIFLVAGFALLVSSLNVFFRDLQHLISIIMMVWFFGTPIIYQLSLVPERFKFIMQINPMAVFATFYRDIFYFVKYPENLYMPPISIILICLGVTFFFFFIGYFIFKKLEPRFAEEI
ncbi:MAG: ABC transporter permease [Actinobacteria bacterium]|nr:ABC transporter permease [Actinomycetota bacterium]